jgi:rhodanese-related sulfurtransferase
VIGTVSVTILQMLFSRKVALSTLHATKWLASIVTRGSQYHEPFAWGWFGFHNLNSHSFHEQNPISFSKVIEVDPNAPFCSPIDLSFLPLSNSLLYLFISLKKKKKVIYVICKSQVSVKEAKETFLRKGKRQIEQKRKVNLGGSILKVESLIAVIIFWGWKVRDFSLPTSRRCNLLPSFVSSYLKKQKNSLMQRSDGNN